MQSSIALLLVALVASSVYANKTAVEEPTAEEVLQENIPDKTLTLAADATVYNTTNILLSAKVSILVKYTDVENATQTATVVLPANATVDGQDYVLNGTTHDYTEQTIKLTSVDNGWYVMLTFTNSTEHGASKAGEFALAAVKVYYNSMSAPDAFKNISSPIQGDSINDKPTDAWTMRAPVSKSFVCEHGDNLVKVDDIVTVRFDKLQVQPFSAEGATFVQGATCAADKSASDLVPIIVGACLALLVVVVLVAYLIGRARTKRQGYASV